MTPGAAAATLVVDAPGAGSSIPSSTLKENLFKTCGGCGERGGSGMAASTATFSGLEGPASFGTAGAPRLDDWLALSSDAAAGSSHATSGTLAAGAFGGVAWLVF